MYISRVEIDTGNRQKMVGLKDLGAWHSWVENLFPDEFEKGERSRKLWRIDELGGKKYLLLVSHEKPVMGKFGLYGVEKTAEVKPYDAFLDRLKEGEKFFFRTTLNPVKSISSGKSSGKRGRVVACLSVADKMAFLKERSEKNGFALEDEGFYVKESNFELLRKSDKQEVRINKVTYEGSLKITDVELFKTMLVTGLGKKKAYGCGMMTVIPMRQ